MKIQIPLSLVGGACVGAVATFSVIRDSEPTSGATVTASTERPKDAEREEKLTPFADPSGDFIAVNPDAEESSMHPRENTKMDMSDVFQRDACLSIWYMNMNTVVDNLELNTGHKFEKRVGKIYASPIEILEEQAAFLKGFEEETRKIEAAASLNSDSKGQTD